MSNEYIYDTPLDITSEQWLEMLQSDAVFNEKDKRMILEILNSEGSSYTTQIAHKLDLQGRSAVNQQVDQLGTKIAQKIPEMTFSKQEERYGS